MTHSLLIKIDENQHQYYNLECENKRTMSLFQCLGNRPIVFIRLNPDGKEKMFSFNKIGEIKKTKHFDKKFIKLKEKIDFHINNIPKKEITIDYLFYE